MRHEFGGLGNDGAVDVANLPARRPHPPHRLDQQHDRVRATKLRVGVGEMGANVAHRRRAQHRIGDGV